MIVDCNVGQVIPNFRALIFWEGPVFSLLPVKRKLEKDLNHCLCFNISILTYVYCCDAASHCHFRNGLVSKYVDFAHCEYTQLLCPMNTISLCYANCKWSQFIIRNIKFINQVIHSQWTNERTNERTGVLKKAKHSLDLHLMLKREIVYLQDIAEVHISVPDSQPWSTAAVSAHLLFLTDFLQVSSFSPVQFYPVWLDVTSLAHNPHWADHHQQHQHPSPAWLHLIIPLICANFSSPASSY